MVFWPLITNLTGILQYAWLEWQHQMILCRVKVGSGVYRSVTVMYPGDPELISLPVDVPSVSIAQCWWAEYLICYFLPKLKCYILIYVVLYFFVLRGTLIFSPFIVQFHFNFSRSYGVLIPALVEKKTDGSRRNWCGWLHDKQLEMHY